MEKIIAILLTWSFLLAYCLFTLFRGDKNQQDEKYLRMINEDPQLVDLCKTMIFAKDTSSDHYILSKKILKAKVQNLIDRENLLYVVKKYF